MTSIRDLRGGLAEAARDAYRPRRYGQPVDHGGPTRRAVTGTQRLLANLRDLVRAIRDDRR